MGALGVTGAADSTSVLPTLRETMTDQIVSIPKLMTTAEVAEVTRLSASTLRKMRMRGANRPLPWITLGRRVVYRAADVEAFITSGRHDAGKTPKA